MLHRSEKASTHPKKEEANLVIGEDPLGADLVPGER